jgi:hypothetical protein
MGIVRRFCVMDEPVGLLVLFLYFLAWVAIWMKYIYSKTLYEWIVWIATWLLWLKG